MRPAGGRSVHTIGAPSQYAVGVVGAKAETRTKIGPLSVYNLVAIKTYFVSIARGSEDYHLVKDSHPVAAGTDIMARATVDVKGKRRNRGRAPEMGKSTKIEADLSKGKRHDNSPA